MDYILDLTAQQINQNLKKVPELEQDINELSSDLNNNYALKTETPTKVSQLTNDKGYLTSVPSEYVTETELNAKGYLTEHQDLSAYAKTNEVNTNISAHNTNKTSHNDIRLLIQELTTRLNTVANSDDVDLDQLSEIVAYIKNNKDLIDGITTSKVNISDIINNLTTNAANKPLSAAQGVALKTLIDAITVPTKLSELTDDSTHRLVTDTEKSNWNAKSTFSGKFSDLSGKPTTLSGYGITDGATKTEVDGKQPKGDYALKSELPTKVGDLTNDKGYLTSAPVTKVNNKTGAVTLTAEDVGAVAESELGSVIEDALAAAKNSGEFDGKDGVSVSHSWNGTTLTVTSASGTSSANLKGDKGDTYTLTSADKSQIASEAANLIPINDYAKKTEVNSSISTHNTATTSHNDIRLLIEGLTTRLNTLANSDDTTLDQMSEVVAYIKNNKNLIDGITTSKVNVSDIINNLTSSVTNKPLSANMGVELKKLIDAIVVPTKLSELSADSTHRLVTDTEKSTWNNKSNFSGKFSDLSNKPTTLSGYGITDGTTTDQLSNFTTEIYDEIERIENQVLNKYALKSSIPTALSDLSDDSNHRVVTDTEKTAWNNKSNFSGKFTDLTSKPTTLSGYGITDGAAKTELSSLSTEVSGKAEKSEGSFFIVGSGTTDSTAKTSTWVGTSDRITEYYDGLAIRYKIGVAGQTTTTLNINGLGAKPVYLFNTTKLTTQFPVNSIINLIYHANLNSGCWMCSDYDSNTNTYQRVYPTTTSAEYPITARYNTTTGSSYYAEYGRYSTGVTLNPATNTITATTFKGNLDGNASKDGDGNVIKDTYAKKTTAETWTFTLADGSTVTKKVVLG